MVEETVARREADRLRTSRARAEETAGEAAATREEDQCHSAAAREGKRLAPIDNVGDFTHNCRDIRPCAWFRFGLFMMEHYSMQAIFPRTEQGRSISLPN